MRTLVPTHLLFVLLLQTGFSLAIDNDFSSYPEGAQSCLYDSADDAGCSSGSSGAELNQCLCKNRNNFVYNTASCVAKESSSDINAVYETLSSNCAGTGVTLSVSKQAFLAAAAAATQATSTSTPTATSTSSSTPATSGSTDSPSQTPADSGLSTGAKIGIGVGIGFGTITAALAAWFIYAYQRRRHSTQTISDDMPGGNGGGGAFIRMSESGHEYAQDNTHQGAAELGPVSWKGPAGFTTPGYTTGEDRNIRKASVPLLAELGETQPVPVELPADPMHLGYSDRTPGNRHEPVTPEGLSPAGYSQGDISPFTPSRSSESGTYR